MTDLHGCRWLRLRQSWSVSYTHLNLHDIVGIFRQESVIHDNLQEEMLRIVLKRFISTCTRIARQLFGVGQEKEKTFDIIRQYYVLVDLSLIHI